MCAHKRALKYLLFHVGLVKCNFVFGKRINVMASLVDFFFWLNYGIYSNEPKI